jgi:hypothetical protein
MGELIYEGWGKSLTDIPQPISFVTGANLPGISSGNSAPAEPAEDDADWTPDTPPAWEEGDEAYDEEPPQSR